MYLFITILILIALISYAQNAFNFGDLKAIVFKRRISTVSNLFANNFIDPQVLFAVKFNEPANVSLIRDINTSGAYAFITENLKNEILCVYQYNTFDYDEGAQLFNSTIFILNDKRIIALGMNYAEVFYTGKNFAWAGGLLADLASFRNAGRPGVIGFTRRERAN